MNSGENKDNARRTLLITGGRKMKNMNKFGIGFWIGGGVYSLINMIMNYNQVVQSKVLNYNYIITGVAVIGLILNIILLKKTNKNEK